MQHHEDTLDAYVKSVKAVDHAVAIIVVGSVASGVERPDSDVDVYLVVTAEEFNRAVAANRLSFVDRTVATYAGGYVDIKVVTVDYLAAAAERGDDPVRASFQGARVAWSRASHDIAFRVAAIPAVPEHVWDARMASFIAQVRLHGGYFLPQAVALDNTFLLHHAAVHTVSAGGRALLALNRILFRGPKYLDTTIQTLARVPAGYSELARQLLTEPGRSNGDAYLDALETFHDWPLDRAASLSTFVRDNELAWLTGTLPPELS